MNSLSWNDLLPNKRSALYLLECHSSRIDEFVMARPRNSSVEASAEYEWDRQTKGANTDAGGPSDPSSESAM